MNDKVFITHEDISKLGYYFFVPDHEREFLRRLNRDLMGIATEETALQRKQRTLKSLEEKRLGILQKGVEKLETRLYRTSGFRQKRKSKYNLKVKRKRAYRQTQQRRRRKRQ